MCVGPVSLPTQARERSAIWGISIRVDLPRKLTARGELAAMASTSAASARVPITTEEMPRSARRRARAQKFSTGQRL